MAEPLNSTRRFVFKESKILVNVDHASDDLLVVSYPFRSKLFQGILIDSTNRYLPCAYPSPEVVKWSPPRVTDVKDEPPAGGEPAQNRPFYSLSNRFTYFQDVLFQKNVALVKSAKQAKAKAQKMTVRLRPRQVLCSKCRSICNENSENVHSTSNSKKEGKADVSSKNLLTESGGNENQNLEAKSPKKKVHTTLVPKLSRLEPDDIRSLNGGQGEGARVWSDMLEADRQMVLRKKRSVGSMEDLWDETVFEEASKKAKTTPIIKISFGSPGEGTVLKIPSKVRLSGSEGEEEEEKGVTESTKSLKKAMKKAKKEAKRKLSPEREEQLSPEEPNYKKHRHRVKHKKRHKNSKEEEMKDKCLKQKLSISLRRVCGPGEEESWSGESSRSSEPVKDTEETKPDLNAQESLQVITSRVGCENATDCKDSFKRVLTESVEFPRKNRKIGAQERKKLEMLESILEGKTCEISERLGNAILKSGKSSVRSPEVLEVTSKSDLDSVHLVKFAQTSVHSKKGPDKSSEKGEFDKTFSANIKSKDAGTSVNLDLPSVCEDKAKELTQSVYSQTVKDGPHALESLVKSEQNEVTSEIPSLEKITNTKLVSHGKGDDYKIDDTLDDTLISEDSMPELDETIEDALLESDKEMPEGLENQRDICAGLSSFGNSSETWETEREIPVLTRMVDPEEVTSLKGVSKSDQVAKTSLKVNESDRPKAETAEASTQLSSSNVRSKPKKETDISEVVQSKVKVNKSLISEFSSQKTQDSILKDPQSVENRLVSDELGESSGESEFLPAEDNFDCILPPCPEGDLLSDPSETVDRPPVLTKSVSPHSKSVKSTSCNVDESNISKKCVHSPDSKSFEDCLPSKASLDDVKERNASDSAVPPVDPGLDCPPRNNRSKDTHSSVIGTHPLPSCDEAGCEDRNKTVKLDGASKPQDKPSLICCDSSSQTDSPRTGSRDSSSLSESVSSRSIITNIQNPPSLSSERSQDKLSPKPQTTEDKEVGSSQKLDSKLPNFGPFPLEEEKNSDGSENVPLYPKPSINRSSNPEGLDHLSEDSMDVVPHFLGSVSSSCGELSPCKKLCKSEGGSELESTDAVMLDSSLDKVPDFPESGSQGAHLEMTSFRTEDGSVLTVGDIVWAKIHGFPWWPAKVVRLCASGSESGGCDARVAWFGSATSSLMSTDQLSPFIQTFKAKYNRERKSTGYLEAIRQATSEASSRDFHLPSPLAEIDKLLAL